MYQDDDGRYFFNLLQNLVLPTDIPDNLYKEYETCYGDTWPFISHKLYGTTNLYWLVLEANKIINPTNPVLPGNKIKYFKKEVVSSILTQLNTQK